MTKQDIINKLESYTSTTRAKTKLGNCVYYDVVTGNRCAIGILIPEEDAKYLNTVYKYKSITELYGIRNELEFPESLRKLFKDHDDKFLQDVQDIHDGDNYWDHIGLTQRGVNAIDRLKDRYLI
jgi:hypothetical protein